MYWTVHTLVECIKLTTRELHGSVRVCGATTPFPAIPIVSAIALHASLVTLVAFILHSETIRRLEKVTHISSTFFILSFLMA